jgi:LuxR family maltose regulon positive regulatory protein
MLDRERDTLPSNRQALLDYANRLSAAFNVANLSHSRKSTGHPVPLPGPEPLSERELEVLRLMAAGLSSRDIASRDVVSINTVKTQLKSIYGKLGAHNRNDAITAAHDLGLL